MGKEGLKTAVELVRETWPGVAEREAAQLSLLPTPAAVALAATDDATARRSGPGRPPGSRNKRTEEWVEFIRANYRDPALFLAETYARPVEVLAAQLGCEKLEAFNIQRQAAEALLPYLHQKLPQAISIDAKSHATLVLDLGAVRPGAAGDEGLMVIEGTIVENQEVKRDEDPQL